jgi:predicted regulator of Ras-like GTPase activity (Roadblock/LC7/MglB family)
MVDDQATTFDSILQELIAQGSIRAAVLVSADGLPLAAATPMNAARPKVFDPDELAAMVSLVRDVVETTQRRLAMSAVDEVSVVAEDRVRLVCRYFTVGSEAMILAVVAPPQQTYRRLTNQAIRAIRDAW